MSGEGATSIKRDQTTESGRGRSTIEFPYFGQDDAIAVAEAVHAVGGTACDWDQLAAQMKQAPGGGGFRIRVMAARTFGLLTYDRGTVQLTDLGIRIIDPKHARAARVESFLNVPLYKALFEKLKGGMLPPPAAIERTIESLGVAPKQKDKARQAFTRSAKQAGFFEIDSNRLTLPPNTLSTSAAQPTTIEPERKPISGGNGGGEGLHPFIKGLLDSMPQPGGDWPVAARVKWLQTAGNIFDLIYKSEEKGSISIQIDQDQ